MELEKFSKTLTEEIPPRTFSSALVALWWDLKGNWDRAHDALQDDGSTSEAHVHAYLHRKEGDASNARYWYRRAGEEFPQSTLDEERSALVRKYYKP